MIWQPESALKDLQQLVSSQISEQEVVYMAEIQDYISDKSGSWSVGDEHLTMLAGFLANKDNRYPPNVPLLTLQILRGMRADHYSNDNHACLQF